jgi:pimeloyl-ACP methyl ester carboxylesterase
MKNTSTFRQALRRALTLHKPHVDRYVDAGGARVRYIEVGENHPCTPLIVLHGYNGSSDYWYPQLFPPLGRSRRVIAVDLPGNGLSGRLPSYSLQAYVDFLAAFLDALHIRQADFMGHSMGGLLAIAFAAEHSNRVRKLVLVDSAGLPELVKTQWVLPIRALTDSSMRQFRLYPTFIKIGLRARAAREGLIMVRTGSVRRYLRDLTVPTLILWGSRDRVIPLEHGVFMARNIPGARLAVIRGAGHMPFYEQPEQCLRILNTFLGTDDANHDAKHEELMHMPQSVVE